MTCITAKQGWLGGVMLMALLLGAPGCFALDALTLDILDTIKADAQSRRAQHAMKAPDPARPQPETPTPAPAPPKALPAPPLPLKASAPPESRSTPAAANATIAPATGWKTLLSNPVAVFIAILALFTLSLCYILLDTRRKRLRAYILVTDAIVAAASKDGTILAQEGTGQPSVIRRDAHIVSRLAFTNTGKTPATHVTVEGGIKILDWPLDASKLALPGKRGRTLENMGAGGTSARLDMLGKDVLGKDITHLSAMEMENLKTGKEAIWVYGVIRYRDIFHQPHATYYRYFIGGPLGIRLNLSAHDRGNDAS